MITVIITLGLTCTTERLSYDEHENITLIGTKPNLSL